MRAFPFFLLIAILASCVSAPREPAPVFRVSEEELLAVLAGNASSFRSLRGVARITLDEEGQKTVKAKQILLVEKPYRVRSEILGLFGQPLAVAVVNRDQAAILVPGEGVLYKGGASRRNVQRILRLPLEITDLVQFLLYQVPVIDYRSRDLHIQPDGGSRLILRGDNQFSEELEFDARRLLVAAHFRNGEEEVLALRYRDFSDQPRPFPQHMEFILPLGGVKVKIDFSSLMTNVDIDAELFRLIKPEGIKIRPFP